MNLNELLIMNLDEASSNIQEALYYVEDKDHDELAEIWENLGKYMDKIN